MELEWRLGSNELGSNILELIMILGLEIELVERVGVEHIGIDSDIGVRVRVEV